MQLADSLQEWVELIKASDEDDHEFLAMLMQNDYLHPKRMSDGSIAVINKFAFTWAILSDLNSCGYGDRWCFHSYDDAKEALDTWDGEGDPGNKWHRHPRTGRRRDATTGEMYINY